MTASPSKKTLRSIINEWSVILNGLSEKAWTGSDWRTCEVASPRRILWSCRCCGCSLQCLGDAVRSVEHSRRCGRYAAYDRTPIEVISKNIFLARLCTRWGQVTSFRRDFAVHLRIPFGSCCTIREWWNGQIII